VDNETRVDHAVPHCTSKQFYKGILDDKARGVFRGLVWIRPDAQKTNASQVNKNLLLSKEALVDSIPALDIRADDVKASHGSTIGQLEEDPLFYLRSRGIGEQEARALLTHAFAVQILEGISFTPLRERLDKLVMEWLPRRGT
jgi:Fe-S cluster assembly protein SufD